ncbi:hypothetical protein H5410_034149 [Solanum commersonii]|uniref:Uncharacterized protein n=1 Tax=Solanum commersonii TaxID=4109 RepID=A0A9J5YPV0_SOLCO|nr:hypothetical protein H5410_034149 [Solanum commersonii]
MVKLGWPWEDWCIRGFKLLANIPWDSVDDVIIPVNISEKFLGTVLTINWIQKGNQMDIGNAICKQTACQIVALPACMVAQHHALLKRLPLYFLECIQSMDQ